MFNGMMDPELMKIAQEQMNRMSPSDFARIQQQMMANPELVRMASESMKNMSTEDFKSVAGHLKNTHPEEMAEIGEKMANATPEEIATMRTQMDARITYELNAAEILKTQGNKLHMQGKFDAALQKYELAKKNLKVIPSPKQKKVVLACSLNMMSCYLKLGQYEECITEGSEVLACDADNVKALYRIGQAYKELGHLHDAIVHIRKAHEVSPEDDTIAGMLKDMEARLPKSDGPIQRGVVIEELTGDKPEANGRSSFVENSILEHDDNRECSSSSEARNGDTVSCSDNTPELKTSPKTIRSFQTFMSRADPETLTAINGGKSSDISPEMLKAASNMISEMEPEQLSKMMKIASTFQQNQERSSVQESIPPNMSEMFKAASDMLGKMPPEEIKRMSEMAASLKGKQRARSSKEASAGTSEAPNSQENRIYNEDRAMLSNLSSSSTDGGTLSSRTDSREQLQNQMREPVMQQMFGSMIKNMSPEMMANMGEAFGVKLSKEDAERARQAMSSLSPDDLDRMMKWVERVQSVVGCARKTKNWLLGKPGMILAIFMLILAAILHRVGFIGS